MALASAVSLETIFKSPPHVYIKLDNLYAMLTLRNFAITVSASSRTHFEEGVGCLLRYPHIYGELC